MQDLESSEAALRQLRGLCKGETTVVAFDSTQSQTSAKSNETIMTDETALKPDAGKEADLKVEDNPFAFTPGQLGQMFNPKDLSAFYQLGGLHGLEKGLRADRKPILNLDDTGLEEQVTFRDVRDAVRNDKMRDDCTEPLEVPHSFIKPAVSASTKFWIKDSSWVLGRSWVTRYSEKEGWKLFVCHYRMPKGLDDSFSGSSERSLADPSTKPTPVSNRLANKAIRRGRGRRKNETFWKGAQKDGDFDIFDDRELLFADNHGSLKESRLANVDTQLKIDPAVGSDLIMSVHCMKDLGYEDRMSKQFDDPCLQSISGHSTAAVGILRNVSFRLKGTSVTFKRDFWVCDAIDTIVDVMIGADFFKTHLEKFVGALCDGVRSLFAPWFFKKKESEAEKLERERKQREQRIKANELEIRRLQRENDRHRQQDTNNG